MDGDDGVAAIVLAAEHLRDPAGLHFLIEHLARLRELRVDGLARLRPLDQDAQVVALLLQRQGEIAILFQAAAPLQDLLCFDLVFPEVFARRERVEPG